MNPVQFIAHKRDGQRHSPADIRDMVADMLAGRFADYQLSAWLMAAYLRGLDEAETSALTEAMVGSGRSYPLGHFGPASVDKHSTGGVGDKTTLVVAPLCAALGAVVPKMSGRGLGFTGGTLDKLESIPGFRVDLSAAEFESVVRRVGVAVCAQSADFVPADGKLYALRDVTATIESIPLIAASVMSKKLALGCPAIVLDVKVGSGAFMQDLPRATALAQAMIGLGARAGRRVTALLSDMEQPLGQAVGNALEVQEAVDTLRGQGPADFQEHCLTMASEMLVLAGVADSVEIASARCAAALSDGSAARRFAAMVEAQGGDADAALSGRLPLAPQTGELLSPREGYVAKVEARLVGEVAMS
ncbi:MAG: thymidine phosphorylase, partial [Anaerolineae bacterium]